MNRIRIFVSSVQKEFAAGKKTASRDLVDMVAKGILERVETTGRGAYYVLAHKGDTKGTKRSSLVPALQDALIEYTIPDKPNSPLQKYRLTEAGRRLLNAADEE